MDGSGVDGGWSDGVDFARGGSFLLSGDFMDVFGFAFSGNGGCCGDGCGGDDCRSVAGGSAGGDWFDDG